MMRPLDRRPIARRTLPALAKLPLRLDVFPPNGVEQPLEPLLMIRRFGKVVGIYVYYELRSQAHYLNSILI
jgi:hypothetical protein